MNAPAASIPPPDPDRLMVIVESLRAVLEEESGLLEKRDFSQAPRLLRQKQELTHLYHAQLRALSQAGKDALDARKRQSLVEAGRALETVTERNANLLRAAHGASERLMRNIMDLVRKEQQQDSGYDRGAVLDAARKSTCKPVAFNQQA